MSSAPLPGTPGATEADVDEMGRAAGQDVKPVVIGKHALARRVLVVAVNCVEGWTAYCDAVPGKNHDKELYAVARTGCKLHEPIAQSIFPSFANIPYCP